MIGPDELAIRTRFRADIDNVRAAVTWALDCDDADDQELGVRIIVALTYEVTMDRSAGYGTWAERALARVERWQPGQRSAVLGAGAHAAIQRGDLTTAHTLADEAMTEWCRGVHGDLQAPIALGSVLISSRQNDESFQVILDALAASEQLCAPGYSRANLLAVVAHFRIAAGDLDAARDEAEESVRLSRRIGNPSQLAIALTALGSSILDSERSAALAALDESIEITGSGASDVMLATSLAKAAVARAEIGQSAESLDLLARSIRHSVFCGDVPSIVLTLAHGLTVITDFAPPELLIRWTATIEQADYRISDPQRVMLDRAESRAAETVDPGRRAEIRATIATLSFDEAVDQILRELDAEIEAS